MKNSYLLYCGTILSIIAISFFNLGNAGGPPGGFTGSPADGKTCGSNGGCHSGSAVTAQTGWITSDIPQSGYVPGTTYSITATATQTGVTKFGFQLSPQSSGGAKLGTLAASTGTKLINGGKYIEQTTSGTSGTDSRSWTFDWTAPAAGTGDVTFYACFNATNSNGATSGDKIHTSSLTVQEALTGIKELNFITDLTVFPNPNSGKFNIQIPGNNISGTVFIYNILGEIVMETDFEDTPLVPVDISDKGKGIYFLRIISEKEFTGKTIIVRW